MNTEDNVNRTTLFLSDDFYQIICLMFLRIECNSFRWQQRRTQYGELSIGYMQESASHLVKFLTNQAGNHLRGAIHYFEDGYDSLYLREDVEELYSDAKMEELAEYYRQQSTVQNAEEPFSLGNCHCNISCYDDAILFHFAQGDNVGTVITLDPEVGSDILGFITRCLKILHAESPQTIDNAPNWLRE